MKKSELQKIKSGEAHSKLQEMRGEIFLLKSASLAGEEISKKKARIPQVKKSVAQILTQINFKRGGK